jgi:hypothetical protein
MQRTASTLNSGQKPALLEKVLELWHPPCELGAAKSAAEPMAALLKEMEFRRDTSLRQV